MGGSMSEWLDVTDDLPIDVEVGQVLIFDFEGSPIHLKIRRKYKGKIWATKTRLYTPEEFKQLGKKKR